MASNTQCNLGLLEKDFITETGSARRLKKGRFGAFFSVNFLDLLCGLRVSVVSELLFGEADFEDEIVIEFLGMRA